MEFKIIDFDSWDEVSNCQELSLQNIDETDFKLTNSRGAKRRRNWRKPAPFPQ